MPYSITTKDGITLQNIPDDVAADSPELKARVQAIRSGKGGMEAPEAASKNNDLASWSGLVLRSALKGALAIPAMGADAIGGVLNAAQDVAMGKGRGFRFQPTLPTVDNLMTKAGLPEPDTSLQRIVGKGIETAIGAGAGAKVADFAARGASGVTSAVLGRLADNAPTQVASGLGAGLAGQQSAENGGGAGAQFVSSLLGGLAGSGAANLANSGAKAIYQGFAPALQPAEIERRITVALQNQGIDPASITPALKASLMKDATEALKLNKGTLDEAALARLADYRRLDLTPTRGRMTLNPFDITREQNAMKMAAATGARDARLPQIAQDNNAGLVQAMEGLRPVADRVNLGERAMAPIMARDASMQAQVNNLYQQARDTSGRSLPLEGGTFTRMANEALDQANVGSFLPADIAKKMNGIAKGEIPLTVDVAEQLKTSLGNLSRNSADGNVRTALGIVRRALDEAPLQNDKLWNPGNVPAMPGTVPPSTAAAGQTSIDAFNAARQAARQRFGWQEGTPAVGRTLEGAAPDTFIQREILSKSAAAADVQRLAAEYAQNPEAMQAIRSGIVQHLKDAAIGKGNTTATANFSGRGWLSALDGIGDAKLRTFFSPTEIEQLKAIGRVGAVETFQPRGSAVNNSNTAAGIGSLLQGIAQGIKPLANKLPLGQQAVVDPLNSITLSYLERGATAVPQGLLSPLAQKPKSGLLDSFMLPMLATGGLLTAP